VKDENKQVMRVPDEQRAMRYRDDGPQPFYASDGYAREAHAEDDDCWGYLFGCSPALGVGLTA
jgi:hypothetical protein